MRCISSLLLCQPVSWRPKGEIINDNHHHLGARAQRKKTRPAHSSHVRGGPTSFRLLVAHWPRKAHCAPSTWAQSRARPGPAPCLSTCAGAPERGGAPAATNDASAARVKKGLCRASHKGRARALRSRCIRLIRRGGAFAWRATRARLSSGPTWRRRAKEFAPLT